MQPHTLMYTLKDDTSVRGAQTTTRQTPDKRGIN
jgi:hypothetical protein